MAWDICDHKLRDLIMRAEKECRRLENKEEERNITTLYLDGCKRFNLAPRQPKSTDVSHLPTPEESGKANPDSPWVLLCPKCKEKSYVMYPICRSCKDSEGGKYRTMFKCFKCNHVDKSEKFFSQWISDMGLEMPTGSKKELGIKTVTNTGLK